MILSIYMCYIYMDTYYIYILYRYGYTCVCVSFRPSKSRCQVDGNMDLEQVLSTWTKALTGMSALVVDYEGYFSWDSQVTMGWNLMKFTLWLFNIAMENHHF